MSCPFFLPASSINRQESPAVRWRVRPVRPDSRHPSLHASGLTRFRDCRKVSGQPCAEDGLWRGFRHSTPREVPMLTRTMRQWSRRILEAMNLKTRRNEMRARPSSFRPSLEALEDRDLLSANTAIGDVFYIDMENHNLTQPSSVTSPELLLNNPAAPYLNSLMTPGNPNAAQTSYASNYYNAAPGVHPSLPNYLWQEQGTNNGVFNDNTPFGPGGANQGNNPSLSGLLQSAGIPWKSYQEDIDLTPTSGSVNQPGANALASAVAPQSQWTVPLNNFSGTSSAYTNAYNGSNQYNFATKHDGQLYFNATNGGNDTSTSNPEVPHYAPLQQLQTDLNNNTVAKYNLITPDQYNEMRQALC